MPNVPNVPGVPPLSSYVFSTETLLYSDAALIASIAIPPQWGIYYNGIPIITSPSLASSTAAFVSAILQPLGLNIPGGLTPVFASMIDFDFSAESPVSNYPQEQGAFQSYDKVQLPFDIRVRLASGGGATTRATFLSTCRAIRASFGLFSILTPEGNFNSVNCTHIDWHRDAKRGVSLIVVDLWFQEIVVTAQQTFSNVASPTAAPTQSLGVTNPGTLPASASSFLASAQAFYTYGVPNGAGF